MTQLLTPYNWLVLIFYGVGTLLSLGNWRAMGWAAAGAGIYVISVIYYRAGLPGPVVFAGVLDFLIIAALFRLALYRWELVLWIMFDAMLLLNLINSLGLTPTYEHTTALEVLNIVAGFIVIGGAGVLTREGHVDNWALGPWRTVLGRTRHVYRAG